MNTIIKIKNVLINFLRDYFWGIIQGACWTTGLAAGLKLADTLGNYGTFIEKAVNKDLMYHTINAFHSAITLYWDVMGGVDILVLITTILLLLVRGFISPYSGSRYP